MIAEEKKRSAISPEPKHPPPPLAVPAWRTRSVDTAYGLFECSYCLLGTTGEVSRPFSGASSYFSGFAQEVVPDNPPVHQQVSPFLLLTIKQSAESKNLQQSRNSESDLSREQKLIRTMTWV